VWDRHRGVDERRRIDGQASDHVRADAKSRGDDRGDPLHPERDQGQVDQRDDAVRDVAVPAGGLVSLGTTDQHSQVQLYREGPNDKIITFLEVEKFGAKTVIPDSMKHVKTLDYLAGANLQKLINAEKLGTEYALLESRRPTSTVLFPRISPETVGQFIYLYEVATSYMGGLLEINTYDQPAVQLGKDATYALMGKDGYEDLAKKIQPVSKREKRYLI
jgi:glucose-6-phosphate isomerase